MPTAFDPTGPAFCRNPHPVFKALRESNPLIFDEGLGTFVATGYEAVRTILSDRRFTPDRRSWTGYKPPTWNRPVKNGAAADLRPRHAAVRRLLMVALGRDYVDATREYIEEIAGSLLDAALSRSSFDVVGDFGADIPARTFFRMLGVPGEAMADLLPLTRAFFEISEPFLTPDEAQRSADAGVALEASLAPLIAERRERPRGDLLSRLVATCGEEDLTDVELMAALRSLLNAATQTTPYLIANGLLALLRHPQELQRLRDRQVSIASALEELLRFEGPGKFMFRAAREPVVLCGQTIRPGDAVLASPLAANRDPLVFPDPDTLDLSRDATMHIAFGYGVDACLGARLARLEAGIALEALVARLSTVRVTVEPDRLEWHQLLVLHGVKALPLTLSSEV